MMRQEALYNASKDIHIDLKHEMLNGNLLDIGLSNYGVIYNLYKQRNKDLSVEYISGREEKSYIEKGSYDNCIMLFSLSNIWLKASRKNLLKDVYQFLKQDGIIYIWDIDKNYWKHFKKRIKVSLPEADSKVIHVTDLNILKDSTLKSAVKLIEQYFEIIDLDSHDNVYYIKAKKRSENAELAARLNTDLKGSTEVENYFSGNKFKVRSQQFSCKILERIHKRLKI